ncbi:MAG: single-stranded-DNA-specific exonuclease RecJ [Eggerthellaceae bacterium]|nr:single-stranded-DNA-specific exonuclease RecJ [Eggerthellaceae bacterium]
MAYLQQQTGLPRIVAATMVTRGIDTPEKAKSFLNPSLEQDWLDPYLIPGLSAVADLVQEALKKDRHIVVFGDFDLDGISATATLTRGLRALGGHVTPFVPLRFEEGYGLSQAAVERMLMLKPELVVTVDCGIASKHEAEIIRAAGVAYAVTDHHEPADLVPLGVPIADPKLDANCPSSILAGVGVALKLVQVLGGRFGKPHLWQEYTDLATLGTVADLMPMLSENRALVADGIARMSEAPRPCIAALFASAGVSGKKINAINISFSIIPRLNAAGRMGDAQLALDLLLSDSFTEAQSLAEELEAVNDRRRLIESELSEKAKDQAEASYSGQRVVVVAGEGWHEGVKGIVASRLVNKYGVPALLFSIEGDEARGSGRSVGQVNLFKAVESLSHLLTRFGGHEAAVGVTLPAARLEEFATGLAEYMDQLPPESFSTRVEIDACVDLEELRIPNVEQLERLAPFGQENPIPCFLAQNLTLSNCRAVGADKNHFSCALTDGKNSLSAIMFHCFDIDELMQCGSVVNAAFELQIDQWNNRRSVKALITSLFPAQTCLALEACVDASTTDFMEGLHTPPQVPTPTPAQAPTQAPTPPQTQEQEQAQAFESTRLKNRRFWEAQASFDPEALRSLIISALIGEHSLHDSQLEVLEHLAAKRSVLAVMPTGRGKSLTFFVHAATSALLLGTTSLFIYPLRALIADQAFHISETLEAFGIATRVLNGETPPEQREAIYAAMERGEIDIVLTTPEFLNFHAGKFKRSADIAFVVVDEAHHIGLAKAGQRPAYALIGNSIAKLSKPGATHVLALTATADAGIAEDIREKLGIELCVCDETKRANLKIDDQRNLKDRESYLAKLVAGGEKTVIYVNSREQSIALARALRKLLPHLASLIGFYNAGLSRLERKRIEELFRKDALCVLVATSAFGEGVNIPNIRHVVLFHMPFNEIEFNQMSGRAGRDGETATIHLLFGRTDAGINEQILFEMTPNHDSLAQIYRELRRLQKDSGQDFFIMSNAELAEHASRNTQQRISPVSAACGVAVFRDLGLLETAVSYQNGEMRRSIRVFDTKTKVELSDSIRYCEGLGEQEAFYVFRDWVFESEKALLEARIAKAILPFA